MVNIAQAFAEGTRHHQSGELDEAEAIYRQILTVAPGHPHVLHQLGMLELQGQRFESAVDLIGKAIQVEPSIAAFHANLGEAYRHLGRRALAIECLKRAVSIQPELAAVHSTLGNLLRAEKLLPEAAAALREAIRLRPQDAEARTRLGNVLLDLKLPADAAQAFRDALQLAPNEADAHFGLATALQDQSKLDEALAIYQTVLDLNPSYAEAHVNLGIILKDRRSIDDAVARFLKALELKPGLAVAHHNLGTAYEAQDKRDAAFAQYRAAIDADPELLAARKALGVLLMRNGRYDEAWGCFQEVLRQDPRDVGAHVHCGNLLHEQGKLHGAVQWYQKAIAVDPRYAPAYSDLGAALSECGQRDQAIESCRKALELMPGMAAAHSNMAVALQAVGQIGSALIHHRKAVELDPHDSGLHANLLYHLNYESVHDPAEVFAVHRAWGERHADPRWERSRPHLNDRSPGRRLRIGYVSGHFADHAVNFFSEPILASHDHVNFEIFCYSNVSEEDDTTRRLRGYADAWHDISNIDDRQASELVRRDQIDILVDLAGHIGDNRLLVFAHKPAPVQVTYIGYQNTTGMQAMDYRLTDDYADPPGTTDAFYTEKLVRLPRSFFCYLPSSYAPAVVAPPALEKGCVTFGSMNNFTKVTPEVLSVWATILTRVPGSRLVVLGDMVDSLKRYLTQTFERHGVGPERLELANRRPRPEYLQLIQSVDIALDPFPFNGHTTTCDALWQGVPVVNLSGSTYASRFGGSGLATVGLSELIADSIDRYTEIAVSLANDLPRLTAMRGGLRQRMTDSPLLDFAGFTRNLEAAYRKMWAQWCGSV
jgi:protein O-GlcNAc transferase